MSIEIRRLLAAFESRRFARVYGVALVLVGLAGCGGTDAADPEPSQSTPAPANGAAAAAAPPANRPASVADLFPPGEGRDLVLNNCATCHAVACAAMGQRTNARWRELESAHSEHVPALSDEDRSRIFTYLRTHFNDTQPEPDIPPEFLTQGCTPF
jgi:mono/diheme cytochrome c family protein